MLDGEIVALDEQGQPAGFQRLQNRIHLTESNSRSAAGRVAFIAFDILRDGSEDLRPLPFTERRARLERLFRNPGSPILRTSEVVHGRCARVVQAGARTRMGRADRERCELGVSHRQTHARLAEAQDCPGAGVRGRRVDRFTHNRPAVWRAAAGLLQGRRPDVRRPHGQRVQPARARTRDPPAEAAGDSSAAVYHATSNQRAAALDEALARGPIEIHGVDRRRTAPPSDLSRHEGRCETGVGETGAEEESEESRSPKSRESRESRGVAVGRNFSSARICNPFSINSTRSSAGRTRGRCAFPMGRRWRSAISTRCSGRS